MLEPEAVCNTCGRIRAAMKHLRNQRLGPAKAAKNWLRNSCWQHHERQGKPRPAECDIHYRAGVDVQGIRQAIRKASDDNAV